MDPSSHTRLPPATRLGTVVPAPVRRSLGAAARGFGVVTAGLRPLPDFIVIGAKRGATTSLYQYLRQHPRILPPFPPFLRFKGAHYFDLEHARGERWYRSHFPTRWARQRAAAQGNGPVLAGEASPYYLYHPLAPERVHRTVPGARLLVLVRNPVDRAYSHYRVARRLGIESLPFPDAIEAEERRLAGEAERLIADPTYRSVAHEHQSYMDQGYYAKALQRWLQHFPREQILIERTEDLVADPQGTCARIFDFLGLPPHRVQPEPPMNSGVGEPIDPGIRRELAARAAPHNRALEELWGRPFGWD